MLQGLIFRATGFARLERAYLSSPGPFSDFTGSVSMESGQPVVAKRWKVWLGFVQPSRSREWQGRPAAFRIHGFAVPNHKKKQVESAKVQAARTQCPVGLRNAQGPGESLPGKVLVSPTSDQCRGASHCMRSVSRCGMAVACRSAKVSNEACHIRPRESWRSCSKS